MNGGQSKRIHMENDIARRNFIKRIGALVIGSLLNPLLPNIIWVNEAIAALPASEGYLLVDTKKCQGCGSCMLACSLVNEGMADYTKARIQIIQNPFEKWPMDVVIAQCRQCKKPACVSACPENAIIADDTSGYVRRVDPEKCVGCGECVAACPFIPSRCFIASDKKQEDKAFKCDLCTGAKYHWDESGGGPNGKQACVEVCPMKAIKFTKKIPEQKGDAGYNVNLRDWKWGILGYPMD